MPRFLLIGAFGFLAGLVPAWSQPGLGTIRGVGLASPICLGYHRLRFQKRRASQVDRVQDCLEQRFLVAHGLRAREERQ